MPRSRTSTGNRELSRDCGHQSRNGSTTSDEARATKVCERHRIWRAVRKVRTSQGLPRSLPRPLRKSRSSCLRRRHDPTNSIAALGLSIRTPYSSSLILENSSSRPVRLATGVGATAERRTASPDPEGIPILLGHEKVIAEVSFARHLVASRRHRPFDGWGSIPRVADVEILILIFPSPRESPPRHSDATRSALRSPRAHRDRGCRRRRQAHTDQRPARGVRSRGQVRRDPGLSRATGIR